MFGFNLKRKLWKILVFITTFLVFANMSLMNCFANPDDTAASMFSEYVIEQFDQITKKSKGSYVEIFDDDICNYEKTIFRYDDRHSLIEDSICEREVYNDIKKTVDSLISKIDKSNDLEKASVIYKWVAENINYDHDSQELPEMATQNAFCAFKYKKAVCAGYSCLLQMMMKLANIPCGYVSSIANSKTNRQNKELNVDIKNYEKDRVAHAFNVIYLKDETNQRTGWTLIDSTWASDKLHQPNSLKDKNEIFEKFFPALNKNTSFKDANEILINMKDHKIKCIKCNSDILNCSVSYGNDNIWMTSDESNLKLMYIPWGPQISMDSDDEDIEEEIKSSNEYKIIITEDLSKFKVPIFFYKNEEAFNYAKEVIIEGNVEIDFNESKSNILKEIKDKLNFEKSNKYKFDEKDKNKILDKVTGEEVFDFSKK